MMISSEEERQEMLNLCTILRRRKTSSEETTESWLRSWSSCWVGNCPETNPWCGRSLEPLTKLASWHLVFLFWRSLYSRSSKLSRKTVCLMWWWWRLRRRIRGERRRPRTTTSPTRRRQRSLQPETGGEGGEVLCLCSILLHSYVLHLQLGLWCSW